MMTEQPEALWQWRVRKHGELGSRQLGWTMTEEQAREWAHRNGYIIEKCSELAEVRKVDR